jgi:hypothetical protein
MFRDDAYRAICMSLNCVSGCCNEDTNIMVCGLPRECLEYNNYVKAWRIAIITILSVLIPFGVIWGIVRSYNKRETCNTTIILTFAVIGVIIFFPIVLIVMLIRCIINSNKTKKTDKVRQCFINQSVPVNVYNNNPSAEQLAAVRHTNLGNKAPEAVEVIAPKAEDNQGIIVYAEQNMLKCEMNLTPKPTFLSEYAFINR